MLLQSLVLSCLLIIPVIPTSFPELECTEEVNFNATFVPAHLRMEERITTTVHLTIPVLITNSTDLVVTSSDTRIFQVTNINVISNSTMAPSYPVIPSNCNLVLNPLLTGEDISTTISVKITGVRLGKADLIYTLIVGTHEEPGTRGATSDASVELPMRYPVVVLRHVGLEHRIFHIVVQILLGILNFGFGCELDMAIVWSYIKKPLAPSIGFCSQFLIMPVLGMSISQILQMDPVYAMGLVALSCAPGGGASNSWTLLLGGDIDLSLTMTFLSLLLALGMMPMWMFIMSRLYFDPSVVQVPYLQIIITLSLFVAPCFLGILLRKVKASWAKPFSMVIKPLSLIFLLWVLTFGTYVNLYMFRIMGQVPLTIVAGILLPWCGFAFGFAVSTVLRQGQHKATAIAIETGIQNIGIPIVLLQRSFPQPEGDLGATMVNSVAIFTPVPLFIALIITSILKRCRKDKKEKDNVNVEFVTKIDIEVVDASDTLVSSCDVISRDADVISLDDDDRKTELFANIRES